RARATIGTGGGGGGEAVPRRPDQGGHGGERAGQKHAHPRRRGPGRDRAGEQRPADRPPADLHGRGSRHRGPGSRAGRWVLHGYRPGAGPLRGPAPDGRVRVGDGAWSRHRGPRDQVAAMSSDATDTGQYGEDMITGAPWADDPVWLPVEHFSAVGAVRRTAVSMAEDAGLPADLVADVAIVASEIASNLARHARAGVVAVRTVRSGERGGIELLGVDSGPGIPNVGEATMGGHSTGGSRGIGLGAVERKASQFDIYSKVGSGTVLAATLWCPAERVPDPWVAGLVRPIAGQ